MPNSQVQKLEKRVTELESFIKFIFHGDRFTFKRPVEGTFLFGATEVDANNGMQVGTATSQKVAFFGSIPVDQPATVNNPSGGVTQDAESRTAIIAVIDRLQELGLIA